MWRLEVVICWPIMASSVSAGQCACRPLTITFQATLAHLAACSMRGALSRAHASSGPPHRMPRISYFLYTVYLRPCSPPDLHDCRPFVARFSHASAINVCVFSTLLTANIIRRCSLLCGTYCSCVCTDKSSWYWNLAANGWLRPKPLGRFSWIELPTNDNLQCRLHAGTCVFSNMCWCKLRE
jgi:hypothetical protein